MQSLVKLITSVYEGLTACPWIFPNFLCLQEYWKSQVLIQARFEVIICSDTKIWSCKKKHVKKSQLLGFFSPVHYLPVGNAIFKLLICLLWVLRTRIFLPHLPNPWLWGTAHCKLVSMAILCKSPIMLCKKPAGSSAPLMHVLHPSQSWTLSNTFLWRSTLPTWRAWCSTWSQ